MNHLVPAAIALFLILPAIRQARTVLSDAYMRRVLAFHDYPSWKAPWVRAGCLLGAAARVALVYVVLA